MGIKYLVVISGIDKPPVTYQFDTKGQAVEVINAQRINYPEFNVTLIEQISRE